MIGRDWVEKTRAEMGELPRVMASRFVTDYVLSEYDAGQLTLSKAVSTYFEDVVCTLMEIPWVKDVQEMKIPPPTVWGSANLLPKLASNWIIGEVARRLNAEGIDIDSSPVSAIQLAALLARIADGTISNSAAKKAFDRLWANLDSRVHSFNENGGFEYVLHIVDAIVISDGLKQMNDSSELEKIIDDVLAANAKNVEEIKAGNTKAMNALVGQAMKATKGKANPAQVNELLKQKIG